MPPPNCGYRPGVVQQIAFRSPRTRHPCRTRHQRAPSRPAAASNGIAASVEESLEELSVLAESAGAEVIDRIVQSREAPQAATLIGSGKVEELALR